MDLRADHRQTQTLSPRLQHAVRLLQMSSLDFAAMLRDTLGRNPFLEAEDGDGDMADGAAAPQVLSDGAELPAAAAPVEGSLDNLPETDASSDRDLWSADGQRGLRRAEDGDLDALDLMAVETPLNEYLHG